MTRPLPSGTPTRSKRYLSPVDTGRRWLLAALIGAGLLVAPVALYFAGAPAFVSPLLASPARALVVAAGVAGAGVVAARVG